MNRMIHPSKSVRTGHARSAVRGPMCTPAPVIRAVLCKSAMSTDRDVGATEPVGIDMMSLPVIRGWPMIGMSKYFVDHTYDLTELHKQHGSVFMINFGLVLGGWNLAVSDMESIKDVLSSDGNRFVSSWPAEYVRLFSPFRREMSPEEQKKWKRIMLRILSHDNVMNLQLPLMVNDITKRIRDNATSGKQILWLTESRRIAFGVAARASMGSLITEAEICAYFKLFNKLAVMGTSNFGLRDGIPGTRFWDAVQARNQIVSMVYTKVKAALEAPGALDGERSGVARLRQALQEEDSDYSATDLEEIYDYIANNAYFLMFAGTDTSSFMLLRMAILLNRHSEWFQTMQEEQDRLRQEFGDTIDRKVLSRSAVATAFATEMLRDKIPANAAFRTAARDTVVSGVRIPKGTGVIVNLRNATHKTGTPEFDPGQWLNSDMTSARPNDATGNLVWSNGPRRCAGQSLATVEIITCLVILAREVQRFEIPPEENDHDYFANQDHPTGMPITLIPRA